MQNMYAKEDVDTYADIMLKHAMQKMQVPNSNFIKFTANDSNVDYALYYIIYAVSLCSDEKFLNKQTEVFKRILKVHSK